MKDIDYKHFRALADVLLDSIKRKDYTIVETLSRFYYSAFKKVRDDAKDKPVVYPNAYYEVVYRIIDELASQPSISNPIIAHRTAGSIWLLGEGTETEISEDTYRWIWHNLLVAVKYEKDEFVLDHWQTAHQYVTFSLRYLQPEYNRTIEELVVKNQEKIENRKFSRKRFIEFHYALGGLLLYGKRLNVIKRMFEYTTSTPPRYELLPEHMAEIFYSYNEIRDPYDRKYTWIEHVFPFPDLAGLNAGSVIKRWISSYMALLFLRQYTIYPYLIVMKPLQYPQPPKTQSEIRQWIEGLDFFKTLVKQHLDNRELLEILSLTFLTREWCDKNDATYPTDFLDNLKRQLEETYETNAKNLPISKEKEQKFIDATRDILESTIKSFEQINNPINLGDQTEKWLVNGESMVQDKDALSESPQADHMNYHSILSYAISEEIRERISRTFLIKTTKSFVLNPVDIFKAIDILGINNEYVIIGFGLDIDHYLKELKVSSLSATSYKGIQVILQSGTRSTDAQIFLLKSPDLPSIKTLQLGEKVIATYSLKKISDTLNLYASVVDLANNDALRSELKKEKSEDELRKSALLTIGLALEVSWKKQLQLIQLIEYSEYRQSGMPNTLDEVRLFQKGKG